MRLFIKCFLVFVLVSLSYGCTKNNDCLYLYHCDLEENRCIHNPLFPMKDIQIIGSVFIGIIVGLANAGGMGGGPVMVPLVLGIFNYDIKGAIMISYLLVCGGAIGNYCRFGMVRNEKTDGPMVNYDLVLISVPMLTIGATFGVMFNYSFPPIFITIILVIVCLQSFVRAFKRTLLQYRSDRDRKIKDENANNNALLANEEDKEKEQSIDPSKAVGKEIRNLDFKKLIPDSKSRRVYLQELILYPPMKITKILLLLVSLLSIDILQGSKEIPSILGISYCGPWYWVITTLTTILCFSLVFIFGMAVVKKNLLLRKLEKENNVPSVISYDLEKKKIINFGRTALIAGFLGGMLGIGGGIILTPLWLSFGVEPQETTSSSIVGVIFTSFVSSFQVIMSGGLQFYEVYFFFPLSFISSLIIAIVLKFIIDKTGYKSILLIILNIKIVAALIALPALTINRMAEKNWRGIVSFNGLCK